MTHYLKLKLILNLLCKFDFKRIAAFMNFSGKKLKHVLTCFDIEFYEYKFYTK